MIFTVYANCQGNAIAKTLLENSDFSARYQLEAINPVQTLTSDNINDVAEKASKADLFIYQPIKSTPNRPTELSSDYLLSILKSSSTHISFPAMYFDGYFPHLQTMHGRQSVLSLVHDYIVAYCSLKKLDVQDTLRLIRSSTLYSNDLSNELCEQSLQNLEKREHASNIDIRLSGFIRNNFRKLKLFNQFNHPTRALFVHLANEIFTSIGYENQYSNITTEYLDDIKTPIYRSTHANLSLEFDEDFNAYNSILGRNAPQELIVEKFLAFYAQTDQDWLKTTIQHNKPFIVDIVEKWLDRH